MSLETTPLLIISATCMSHQVLATVPANWYSLTHLGIRFPDSDYNWRKATNDVGNISKTHQKNKNAFRMSDSKCMFIIPNCIEQ